MTTNTNISKIDEIRKGNKQKPIVILNKCLIKKIIKTESNTLIYFFLKKDIWGSLFDKRYVLWKGRMYDKLEF